MGRLQVRRFHRRLLVEKHRRAIGSRHMPFELIRATSIWLGDTVHSARSDIDHRWLESQTDEVARYSAGRNIPNWTGVTALSFPDANRPR